MGEKLHYLLIPLFVLSTIMTTESVESSVF